MKRLVLVVALLCVVVLLSGACAKPAPTSAPPPSPTATAKPAPTPAPSPAAKLPSVITISAHPASMGMGAWAIAVAESITKYSPMKAKVEPGNVDTAMIAPLHLGDAEFLNHTGATAYQAVTGFYKDLGIVQLRRVWSGPPYTNAMGAWGDSGFQKISDLKGKRIGQNPGSEGWSLNQQALLAFGGLTLKDVQVVTVPSTEGAYKMFLEGALDAVAGLPDASAWIELAAGRHGVKWFPMPPEDVEAWKRLKAIRPFYGPIDLQKVPGMPEGKVLQGGGYEQAIWSVPKVSDAIVYAFCKALKQRADAEANAQSAIKDWTWKQAYSLQGVIGLIPYHNATVQFYKDTGVWTPEHEKFQQEALRLEKERLGK